MVLLEGFKGHYISASQRNQTSLSWSIHPHPNPSTPVASSRPKQNPFPTIQLIRLLPQRISLELPERHLDPLPRLGILRNRPLR